MNDALQSSQEQLAGGLERLGQFLRAAGWRDRDTHGLTPTQARIVTLLANGALRTGELARAMSVAQPTVTEAVTTLVDKGLVRKATAPEDARVVRLHLTRKGANRARKARNIPAELMQATEALSEQERAVFLKGLTKIIRGLQIQGAMPVQRMCASCVYFRPNVHGNARTPHHCDFVDAAFGDAQLRLDCGDHETAGEPEADVRWRTFTNEDPG